MGEFKAVKRKETKSPSTSHRETTTIVEDHHFPILQMGKLSV